MVSFLKVKRQKDGKEEEDEEEETQKHAIEKELIKYCKNHQVEGK